MSDDAQHRSQAMSEADVANGERGPDDAQPTAEDPEAPGTGAAAPSWPQDPAEPNEPG